jgi:hypothetical protein
MFTRCVDVDPTEFTQRITVLSSSFNLLIHIMLVLAYNGFWVNFTNSAKGSLNRLPIETSQNGYIIIWKFFSIFLMQNTPKPASETIKLATSKQFS